MAPSKKARRSNPQARQPAQKGVRGKTYGQDVGGLIGLDKRLSYSLYLGNTQYAGLAMPLCKVLEISAHGIPAFILSFIAIVMLPVQAVVWVNLFAGLLLDIVVIAIAKLIFRRQRPVYNKDDMFATVSVDKFSFPSGHTTRVAYLASLSQLVANDPTFRTATLVWTTSVAISRVVLGRHHVGDVLVGVVFGVLQFRLQEQYLWLGDAQSAAIQSYAAAPFAQYLYL